MRKFILAAAAALVATALPFAPPAQGGPVAAARRVEPIVLTGDQIPDWSRLAAQGVAKPYPSGNGRHDDTRDAHNGTLYVPPDARSGAPVDKIAAYRFVGGKWEEIPVQVDERFPYFLANANSGFAFYSGTDEELTYEWDEESWHKTAGECYAEYPEGYAGPTQDPVATFDDDDELVFMASDAGEKAPPGGPNKTSSRHEVTIVDPLDPTKVSYVYLFLAEKGPSLHPHAGYVRYERDANADEWIDRHSFAETDPEKLGTSNRGYGPNLGGTVCDPNTATPNPHDYTVRGSDDRFPRDGVTVTTDSYQWRATGRWMVREMHVARPGSPGDFGPDLIDRWKGRAFQQSPDSRISLVGFEDEQVNWEGNSVLLGELAGPVRAIREIWGADSGTNVTKTETFYRDSITYRYRVRVHPIPPDGLYTSWDYNQAAVSTYYNELTTQGVPIDGRNDDTGQIDEIPGFGPAFFDAPDPTFGKPLSFFNWEQVSGRDDNGSLVYMFELKNAQAFENPLVFPYYRDDACLDDGTGDDPSPRAYPGESYEWMENRANDPVAQEYLARPCFTEAPEGYSGPYKQGCFACHGLHFFITGDTDNAFGPKPVTEIDGQQWQWAVPTAQPTNVGDPYANTVKVPLRVTVTPG